MDSKCRYIITTSLLLLATASLIMLLVVSIQYGSHRLIWGQTQCTILNCSYVPNKYNYTVAYNDIIYWFTMNQGAVNFCLNGTVICYYNKNKSTQVCFLKYSNNWYTHQADYDAMMITLLVLAITLTIFGIAGFCIFTLICQFCKNRYEQIE